MYQSCGLEKIQAHRQCLRQVSRLYGNSLSLSIYHSQYNFQYNTTTQLTLSLSVCVDIHKVSRECCIAWFAYLLHFELYWSKCKCVPQTRVELVVCAHTHSTLIRCLTVNAHQMLSRFSFVIFFRLFSLLFSLTEFGSSGFVYWKKTTTTTTTLTAKKKKRAISVFHTCSFLFSVRSSNSS